VFYVPARLLERGYHPVRKQIVSIFYSCRLPGTAQGHSGGWQYTEFSDY